MDKPSKSDPLQIGNEWRTGMGAEALKKAVIDNLVFRLGKYPELAGRHDYYAALAYAVRDRLLHRWVHTLNTYLSNDQTKVACYFSAEFLLGPHLGNNLLNLGMMDAAREAVSGLGMDLDELMDQEEEPGLGNGGLGRLAACYLESLASLERPAIGYGIRYEFGIFDQEIKDGWQVEITDKWLQNGNPWEIPHPEIHYHVPLGGHTQSFYDRDKQFRVQWIPDQHLKGIAYDTPILGYRVNTCNTLRLWKAEACESFDFQRFNVGDYYSAVQEKVQSETISKILYPNDEPEVGKRLRLTQQYFFVSCSLQDILRIQEENGVPLTEIPRSFAVQLNDTHPSIAVAELMRLLVDERQLGWEEAWEITTNTIAYTNHTLLPEALETWSLPLFKELLPRHLEIIYEINHRFLDVVREAFPDDEERVARLSIIDENGDKRIRMANLACIGSNAINGVAALHTELLKKSVLKDFHELWPGKIRNITNGITPRRFVLLANPKLSTLLNDTIGTDWATRIDNLRKLEAFADDGAFREKWQKVKLENKQRLAALVKDRTGISVDPHWMFSFQIKRIHEYKRQHLNVLHIISLYRRLKENPSADLPPRVFIFGGKAAPAYVAAKRIIKLITSVAEVINNDPQVKDRLRVVFFPDYNVKNAQPMFPAADLSEQISTAGKEASGTGNMKFAFNGALTIGTLDGANVEIREAVGAENFFLFGLKAEEVEALRRNGYDPQSYIRADERLKRTLDSLVSGQFSGGDTELFRSLNYELSNHDQYFLTADFSAYLAAQEQAGKTWLNQAQWTRMSVLNTARMSYFSSDRAIREYCDGIWKIPATPVRLD